MDPLDRCDGLARRSDELRARSARIRGAAGAQMADNKRLIAATAEAREAVRRAPVPGSVPIVGPVPCDTPPVPDAGRAGAMRLEGEALARRCQEAIDRAQATREQILQGRSQRQVLHDSAYARLQAKLDTMPVIEQAKGIIMAQQGCGPEEAFDLLRRASQRANTKVHILAEQMVQRIASSNNGGAVAPLAPGTTRNARARAASPAG